MGVSVDDVKKQIQELQNMLARQLDEARRFNASADVYVDRGIDAVEKSPYSPWIVGGVLVVVLALGVFAGWNAHGLFGK
jgi:hypothetical protein